MRGGLRTRLLLISLAAPTFAPRETVVVETDASGSIEPLPTGGRGAVKWLQDAPEAITLRVQVPEGGWLVLADAPFPGWRAWVDGEEAEWLPANLINRALFLPPGDHLVVWRYRTPSLVPGAVGSGAGLLLLLAMGWRALRR